MKIVVKTVINQNSRAENHGVLDKVHPSIERLGRQIVTTLGIELTGQSLP